MSQTRFVRTAIAAVFALSSMAASAVITNPTPQRAYVSLHGLDTNNCGPTAPCRTFAMALTQVNPNGEVLVLDSGAFGTLSITQAVSIVVPPGVYGGISVFSGDGVTINAPGYRVMIRGLTVNGQGGATGINIISAGDVVIADSTVTGMVTGINMASAGVLHVTNTRINANSGVGIHLAPSSGGLFASVHGSHVTSNGSHGIDVADNTSLDLKGSDVSVNGYGGNGGYGLNATGTIALAPNNLSIGIDAQNNDFSANSSGGVSIDDTSGTLSSIAYLEHNAVIGHGNCFNVVGNAGMKLAWNTASCWGSGVTVGASATGLTFNNNSITALGTGVAVSGTLTATSFR